MAWAIWLCLYLDYLAWGCAILNAWMLWRYRSIVPGLRWLLIGMAVQLMVLTLLDTISQQQLQGGPTVLTQMRFLSNRLGFVIIACGVLGAQLRARAFFYSHWGILIPLLWRHKQKER